MILNSVTPSLSLSHNQQQEKGNTVNDDLNGIMPKDQLIADLTFQLKNFFEGKVVCQEQNIYAVNCRAATRKIQNDITPRQITGYGGAGGGG